MSELVVHQQPQRNAGARHCANEVTGVSGGMTDMNIQSPKLFIVVALIFAAIVCIGVVAPRMFGKRTPLDAEASAQALQTAPASGSESVELRVQSLILRGSQLRDAGRYKEAEPLLKESLALAEEAFGKDALEVAATLNQLGMLGKYDGHFDQAEAAYRRALQITEKAVGFNHPLAATLFHNFGGLEHARGRFAEGEPYARRSVESRERLLGSDHPETAADVAALAALLDGQGKYGEAE